MPQQEYLDVRPQLGDRVCDAISGFTGIITGRYEYLNGCIRYGISPTIDKEGKLPDTMVFDEHQIRVIEQQVVAPKFPPNRCAECDYDLELDEVEDEADGTRHIPADRKVRTGGPRDSRDTTRDRH